MLRGFYAYAGICPEKIIPRTLKCLMWLPDQSDVLAASAVTTTAIVVAVTAAAAEEKDDPDAVTS